MKTSQVRGPGRGTSQGPGGPARSAARGPGLRFARCRGFTLVEMLLATVLMAILALSGISSFESTLSSSALDGQTERLRTQLYWLRERAVNVGYPQRALFDPAADSYELQGEGPTGWVVLQSLSVPEGIDLVSTSFPGDILRFEVGGLCNPGGTIVLSSTTESRELDVEEESGLLTTR